MTWENPLEKGPTSRVLSKPFNQHFKRLLKDKWINQTDYLKLETLNIKIRSLLPEKNYSAAELSEIPSCVEKAGYLDGKTVRRLIMVLTPHGCDYCLKSGGCFMCGEIAGSTLGLPILARLHISQFINAYWRQRGWNIPWIMLYNEGSILNSIEVSPVARNTIFGILCSNAHERVTIESRPEYVTRGTLYELKRIELALEPARKDSTFEIGIGLEVQDETARKLCVHKGFTRTDYERAVKLIKSAGMRVLTYVLVKPPFFTEEEAIEEAIRTTEYAFNVGSDAVSLELTSIHSYTVVEYLWLKGLYRTPWLWSAIEIVKTTHHLGEIRIGGEPDTYYPHSSTAAHNDAKCTKKIWELIERFNCTNDMNALKDASCSCKEIWKEERCNIKKTRSLSERISLAMDTLSLNDYIAMKLKGVNNSCWSEKCTRKEVTE